jgi:putative hydrolase of the HAD superfamily
MRLSPRWPRNGAALGGEPKPRRAFGARLLALSGQGGVENAGGAAEMTIAAVIWDFGGVFTTSPFEAFNRYEAEAGLPRDFIRTVNATNPETNAWARYESAQIGPREFDTAFAEDSRALGHEVRGADVLPLIAGDLRPAMVRALHAVKTRYRTGLITNNFAPSEGGLPQAGAASPKQSQMREIMALFDHVIESSKVGVRKPDPRIYAMMCEALSVSASACVFLDDLGVNLKPAKAMGMATIKVLSEKQALDELAALTGLTFS